VIDGFTLMIVSEHVGPADWDWAHTFALTGTAPDGAPIEMEFRFTDLPKGSIGALIEDAIRGDLQAAARFARRLLAYRERTQPGR